MTGIGLDSIRFDQLGTGVGSIQDIIDYDAHPVSGTQPETAMP